MKLAVYLIPAAILLVFCASMLFMSMVADKAIDAAHTSMKAGDEWKRLFCESTEGRTSMVCQKPGIVHPSLELRRRQYRQVIV